MGMLLVGFNLAKKPFMAAGELGLVAMVARGGCCSIGER